MMLKLDHVHTFYGQIEALKGVSLEVHPGEIVTLIGANGAGKSTLLLTICGSPHAAKGSIVFDGVDITHRDTHEIIASGIAQSPEGRRIFPRMTVMENLLMGATTGRPEHLQEDLHRVFTLFPILKQRADQRGGTLSGGEQQMLAIARALMARPKLLLLDEPSLGLAPQMVEKVFDLIAAMRKEGLTILLVEQNVPMSLQIADRGIVLANGHIVVSGTGAELLHNSDVTNAYLAA